MIRVIRRRLAKTAQDLVFRIIWPQNPHPLGVQVDAGGSISRLAWVHLHSPQDRLVVGAGTSVRHFVVIRTYGGVVKIGRDCSVNPFTVIDGAGGVSIGDHVRIASHVSIVASNHVFEDTARPIRDQGLTAVGIQIGDDVWIGTGARILDGVSIESGAVVAAGAVVTSDVPASNVVAGVPARTIGSRSDKGESR